MYIRIFFEIRRNGNKVKLGGDARCYSPGHTAKYGSYSIMTIIQLLMFSLYR
jgi:hypothetical protein